MIIGARFSLKVGVAFFENFSYMIMENFESTFALGFHFSWLQCTARNMRINGTL